jgi:hypothetical protein
MILTHVNLIDKKLKFDAMHPEVVAPIDCIAPDDDDDDGNMSA